MKRLKRKLISPNESQLAKAMYLEGVIKENGPICNLSGLRTHLVTAEEEFTIEDLLPSHIEIVKPEYIGKERGHYHSRRKEIFILENGLLLLFLSDVVGEKAEIIHFDTTPPENLEVEASFLFPVMYIPPGVSHHMYNPFDYEQSVTVLSRMPYEEACERGNTHDLNAVCGDLGSVLKEVGIELAKKKKKNKC